MFRVVPDQLRISSGWVRCGHCGEVFDGAAHMLPPEDRAAVLAASASATAALSSPAPQPAPAPAPAPTPAAPATGVAGRAAEVTTPPAHTAGPITQSLDGEPAPAAAPAVGARPRGSEWAPDFVHQPAVWSLREPAPWRGALAADAPREQAGVLEAPRAEAPWQPEPPRPWPDSAAPAGPTFLGPVSSAAAAWPQAGAASAAPTQPDADHRRAWTSDDMPAPVTPLDAESAESAESAAPATAPVAPSFVAAARRRAFWSSTPVRAVLWLLLMALALALAVQVTLGQRDWLAAREPRLAPLLQRLCEPLGCTLSPYRLLDAIVIDSSSFNRASGDDFRFSVVLRNSADLPVATPSLELVLTDAQDQPLIRRVFTAGELGAPQTLAARGEFSGARAFTVADPAVSPDITGYRLIAFYP